MLRQRILATAALLPLLLNLAPPGTGATAPQQTIPWLDPAWVYRRPVTVTNSGTPLTDYPVRINLNRTFNFGHARLKGEDLRVTAGDGQTLLPFWIEEWNRMPEGAIVWVQVPSLPTGVLVREYTSPEPAAVVGAEENNATVTVSR